jgi:methyltransferase (TIGR00027 family)
MSFWKPLKAEPDCHDFALHKQLCNPALVTERLGQLVPLLKFVGMRIDQISPERTVLSVPLLESAMNQNGTHQAAVFYLIADYTLGVGMFATLPGCYTVGVHDRCEAFPVQFWLRSGAVQHVSPGAGTIRSEVEISADDADKMRAQLISKGRCELRHQVKIYQGSQLVATTTHEMGLYADLPRAATSRISLAQAHRLKTSALMVAGLRSDPVSAALAGEQGTAIARRISRASPQLPFMVTARDAHLRSYLRDEGREHAQVVVLGAGLDTKELEFASAAQRWFLCDLKDMLRERTVRLENLGIRGEFSCAIPVDFRQANWPERLIEAGYSPDQSTLFVLEGVSMYLTGSELALTLDHVSALTNNPTSRLWLDHVTPRLLGMDSPHVKSFLCSMQRLGEPFLTAIDDVEDFTNGRWAVVERISSGEVGGYEDLVHQEYVFTLATPVRAPDNGGLLQKFVS